MHRMTMRPVIALILSLFCVSAFAAEVNGFRVWSDPDKTRAVLDLSERTDYQLFTLDNPERVVIDLQNSELKQALDFDREHAGVISNVRHSPPEKNRLRVVLDLSGDSQVKSFLLDPTGQYGYRLVIDLYPQGNAKSSIKQISDVQKTNRDIVVAIDAGHGGEDPGAMGKKRTREKDVVLAIAKELKKSIDAQPGMTGVLIRTGDY